MTVKTVSSAAAFSDASTPPASITTAGTVFKSFIYKESVQQKKRPSRSRKLTSGSTRNRPEKGNKL
ncbi:hypothetical protein ENKO_24850 [Enterobacter kobei]|uniref:Uncharacterized protein n=1 Tax=Enterobacter kobei TaxID=208224 RepID=A0AA86M527_9ENTR|nr:hypothetical protein ENKO_24850 [Enterobacter kobei]